MQSKKQLFELFSSIANLNDTAWGNHAGSYIDAVESAYQVALSYQQGYHVNLKNPGEYTTAKQLSRDILNEGLFITKSLNDVDRFDKALDSIIVAVSSMHKLGLTPHKMVDGLQHKINTAKGVSNTKELLDIIKI